MQANLLVVTSTTSFGELIRQSLNDVGSFRVHVVKGKADAILTAEEESCAMALLDMEMGENAIIEIGDSLRRMNRDIDLIILADEELPPTMDSIRPWVLLRKPFYLPDFIQLVQEVPAIPDDFIEAISKHDEVPDVQEVVGAPDVPWLNDVSKAAQHLTRLTLESSAQAALMTRGGTLWAYAGQLSQDAANELAQTVSRHWDTQKGNDLLRFVRLDSTKAEHMLYATCMTSEIILALVFDAETPFSTIRSQANDLAHSLVDPGAGHINDVEKNHPKVSQVEERGQNGPGMDTMPGNMDGSAASLEIPSISEILNEIPPSVPQAGIEQSPPQIEEDMSDDFLPPEEDPSIAVTRPSAPASKSSNHQSRESSPAMPLRDLMLAEQQDQPGREESSEDLAATVPSKPQRRKPSQPFRRTIPGELDETQPNLSVEESGRMVIESPSSSIAQLNFACLLVPRFTSHYMTGDLADCLSEWMPQICVAFGWRLEFLAVRPEYLQWVANVMPNTSPGYLMRIMRRQTSEKIFAEFPRLKHENPSGDFWAPGYLIMGGLQPHPPQLVKEYIRKTRQRQGISQSRR